MGIAVAPDRGLGSFSRFSAPILVLLGIFALVFGAVAVAERREGSEISRNGDLYAAVFPVSAVGLEKKEIKTMGPTSVESEPPVGLTGVQGAKDRVKDRRE